MVLALAVTAIGGLIGSVIASPQHPTTVARNTHVASVMVVLNGVIGVPVAWGRWREQTFIWGTTSAPPFGTLAAVTMILPSLNFVTAPGSITRRCTSPSSLSRRWFHSACSCSPDGQPEASSPLARDGFARAGSAASALPRAGCCSSRWSRSMVLADSLTPTVQRLRHRTRDGRKWSRW